MANDETLAQLRKRSQTSPHTLTAEDKLRLYGPGNENCVRYARRGNVIVSKMFRPGENPGEEWFDSPVKAGAKESHPAKLEESGYSSEESIVSYVDGAPVEAAPAPYQPTPEELAAATRVPTSPVTSGGQRDFGDVDDGSEGPQ